MIGNGVLCIGYDNIIDDMIQQYLKAGNTVILYDDINKDGYWKVKTDDRIFKINGEYEDFDLIETLLFEYNIKDVFYLIKNIKLYQILKSIHGLVFKKSFIQ